MTYQADQFGLYLSLAVHGGVAVDFLDEDALQNSTVMAQYSLLFVTEPNVPADAILGMLSWAKAGGRLVLSGGAATLNEYNQTDATISSATGNSLTPFPRTVLHEVRQVPGPSPLPFGAYGLVGTTTFKAYGGVAEFVKQPGGSSKILATFADHTAAATETRVGGATGGAIVQMAWQPGLSYLINATQEYYVPDPVTQFPAVIRNFLRGLLGADYVAPVVASVPVASSSRATSELAVGIETVLLASDVGAVVSVINWGGAIALDGPVTLRVDLDTAGCFPDGIESLGSVFEASTGSMLTPTSVPCDGGGKNCVHVELLGAHANFLVLRTKSPGAGVQE